MSSGLPAVQPRSGKQGPPVESHAGPCTGVGCESLALQQTYADRVRKQRVAAAEWGARLEWSAEGWLLMRYPGARVVARNLRLHPVGEIDRIFLINQSLLFVEVKARTDGTFGPAHLAFGTSKRRRFHSAINCFLAKYSAIAGGVRECHLVLLTYEGVSFSSGRGMSFRQICSRRGRLVLDPSNWKYYVDRIS